jgi:hypothetical protein
MVCVLCAKRQTINKCPFTDKDIKPQILTRLDLNEVTDFLKLSPCAVSPWAGVIAYRELA